MPTTMAKKLSLESIVIPPAFAKEINRLVRALEAATPLDALRVAVQRTWDGLYSDPKVSLIFEPCPWGDPNTGQEAWGITVRIKGVRESTRYYAEDSVAWMRPTEKEARKKCVWLREARIAGSIGLRNMLQHVLK